MSKVGPTPSLKAERQRVSSGVRTQSVATVLTVFSAKGGCGKTTLATNLSVALADHGRRQVCLVDLDLAFGDVAIALLVLPEHTIADAIPLAGSLDVTSLDTLLTSYSPGLTTLAAPPDPGTAESIPAALVAKVLDVLTETFDFVVIDTPPCFDDHVLAALERSDVVVLVSTPGMPALRNLELTLDTLDLMSYPRDRCRLVINRSTDRAASADQRSRKELEATLPIPVSAHIPSSRDVPHSIGRGRPIVLGDPKAAASQAIINFARALID